MPGWRRWWLRRIFGGGETPVGEVALEMVMTDVVLSPLEERRAHRHFQRRLQARQVAVKELILQGLRAGRHDHLAPGKQGRQQIGEGLARAGAGFGEQHPFLFDGSGHGERHLVLLRPMDEAGDRRREPSARAELLFDARLERLPVHCRFRQSGRCASSR